MPWTTYGDATSTYGDVTNKWGGPASTVFDREYGDLTYGSPNYGGDVAPWDNLVGPQGPPGDPDMAYYPPVVAPLTYPSGWGPYPAYQQPMVYRDRQGFCHLSGVFAGPGNFAAGAVIGYLPPYFWPLNRVMHPVYTGDPQQWGRLDINNGDGSIQINSTQPAGVTYAFIDCLWYSFLPGSFVIWGCVPTVCFDRWGTTSADYWYTVSWTAGMAWDGVRQTAVSVPAGSTTSNFNSGNSTYWSYAMMNLNPVSYTYTQTASTTEGAIINATYGSFAIGQSRISLATFLPSGNPSSVTWNDRRWNPFFLVPPPTSQGAM